MCVTIDQACGFLFINEFGAFVYCCKMCRIEYDSGPNLEVHILSAHQDVKSHIETVFVNDGIFLTDSISAEQSTTSKSPIEPVVVLKHEPISGKGTSMDNDGDSMMNDYDYDNDEYDLQTVQSNENVLCVKLVKKGEKSYEPDMDSDEDYWPEDKQQNITMNQKSQNQKPTIQSQPTLPVGKEKCRLCDICGKNFTKKSYDTHKRTHGEKELKCRYCPKAFKLYENRRKHERSIHEKKWLKPKTT